MLKLQEPEFLYSSTKMSMKWNPTKYIWGQQYFIHVKRLPPNLWDLGPIAGSFENEVVVFCFCFQKKGYFNQIQVSGMTFKWKDKKKNEKKEQTKGYIQYLVFSFWAINTCYDRQYPCEFTHSGSVFFIITSSAVSEMIDFSICLKYHK